MTRPLRPVRLQLFTLLLCSVCTSAQLGMAVRLVKATGSLQAHR